MSFKVCVIGCGYMAMHYHGPAYVRYAAAHSDVVLAACCDIDEAKAAAFRARFGFARHDTDMAAMLDREQPDAVCLIAPEALTCALACQVLEMGYPLLMEKPPGRTVEEIDRMIAAAAASGAPNQVAFNRRYTPLVCALKRRLDGAALQHVRYDFTRVGRADADFSLTAIHGVDTARFLAGSDYCHIDFHYQPFPELGPTAANIFMDCTFASGATAHLDFCPLSGVVVERATVYARDHTYFLNLPIWDAFDAPGRLQHLERGALRLDVTGLGVPGGGGAPFVSNGFYAENAAFFDALRAGQRPAGDLRSARQSVAVAECIRERREAYCA
ncbi:MAG: Gfo/Idh/MocA family oxidoreductase [Anaerolineae bacterium]|nr:Gfo/Idh/MocA family oxidoreductase [Anaerolineae bacterium]